MNKRTFALIMVATVVAIFCIVAGCHEESVMAPGICDSIGAPLRTGGTSEFDLSTPANGNFTLGMNGIEKIEKVTPSGVKSISAAPAITRDGKVIMVSIVDDNGGQDVFRVTLR